MINKAKVVSVTSVKGGTGKTTTVLNLAGVLTKMKVKTLVMDLDLYSGSIASSLNLKEKDVDIYTMCEDILNNRFKNNQDYVQRYNELIDVVAAPIDPRTVNKISAEYIDTILTRFEKQYDIILIDTSHIMDANKLVVLDHSDLVLYVVTNDLMDIKNMKTMVNIFKDMQLDNFKIILNFARGFNTKYTVYDVESILGVKVNYIIPKSFNIKNIESYVYDGKILTLQKEIMNNKSAMVFNDIISNVIKE